MNEHVQLTEFFDCQQQDRRLLIEYAGAIDGLEELLRQAHSSLREQVVHVADVEASNAELVAAVAHQDSLIAELNAWRQNVERSRAHRFAECYIAAYSRTTVGPPLLTLRRFLGRFRYFETL